MQRVSRASKVTDNELGDETTSHKANFPPYRGELEVICSPYSLSEEAKPRRPLRLRSSSLIRFAPFQVRPFRDLSVLFTDGPLDYY